MSLQVAAHGPTGIALSMGFILIPSGISKTIGVVQPVLQGMWPQLPKWFWTPCGVWEIVAGTLLLHASLDNHRAVSSSDTIGWEEEIALAMIYTFLGGVYYSLVAIPPSLFRRNRLTRGMSLIPVTGTLALAMAIQYQILQHFSVSTSLVLLELLVLTIPWLVSGYRTGSFLVVHVGKQQRAKKEEKQGAHKE